MLGKVFLVLGEKEGKSGNHVWNLKNTPKMNRTPREEPGD
jgi:hypothetical protein